MVLNAPLGRAAGAALLARAVNDTLAYRSATAVGQVTAVARDSTGRVIGATVRVGDDDVTLALDGRPVDEGDVLALRYNPHLPAAPGWEFIAYLSTTRPFPMQDVGADIPPPTWGDPPLTPAVVGPTAGAYHGTVTVTLVETPERYGPQDMVIEWATDADAAASQWKSTVVVNRGGQDATVSHILDDAFPLNTTINVRARTRAFGGAQSPYTDLRSITVADTRAPAAPTSLTVDVTAALTAIITLPAPNLPLVFDHWDISIALTAAGGGAQVYRAQGGQFVYQTTTPGLIYVRIREVPYVGAGVPSGWYPGGSWAGPYEIRGDGGVFDTEPPPVPVIDSVGSAVEIEQGSSVSTLTVQLTNTYVYPPDFSHFELRVQVHYSPTEVFPELYRLTTWFWRKPGGTRPGVLHQIEARAFDLVGNASAWSVPAFLTSATITSPPAPGAPPTCTAAYRAVIVSWAATPDSPVTGRIVGYEVQRTTDSGGTPNAAGWTTIQPGLAATRWVDAGLTGGVAYWYRYRPINASGTPATGFSPAATATASLIQGADIAANAITANHLAALVVVAGEIRAEDPGVISAGDGNVVLHSGGVTLNGNEALHFTGETAGNLSAIKTGANRRARVRVVENWHGYTPVGRGLHIDLRSETTLPGLYLTGPVTGSTTVDALVLTEDFLRFLRDTGGSVVRGWGIGYDGITRGDGSVASGWTPHYHNRTWETTVAGTDVGLDMNTLGLPTSGVTGVMLRYSVSVTAGRHFYVHAGGTNAPEHGLHHVTAGATTNVAVFGIVPVLDGLIYLRSTGGTVTGTLVVTGYFR